MRGKLFKAFLLTGAAALLAACEPTPQPIDFGGDSCTYCRMIITDSKFASQTLNPKGRAFKFDSIECMAAYNLTEDDADTFHSSWVPDFLNHGEWIEAQTAVYLHSETLRSPMGVGLSAYADRQSAEAIKNEYGGEIIGYATVLLVVERDWLNSNNNNHSHP